MITRIKFGFTLSLFYCSYITPPTSEVIIQSGRAPLELKTVWSLISGPKNIKISKIDFTALAFLG